MEFEQHPWLLVPIIIVTVEAWMLLKAMVRSQWRRRHVVEEQLQP